MASAASVPARLPAPRRLAEQLHPLDAGWELSGTHAGEAATPADLPADLDWLPATVPGTVAGALADHGGFSASGPFPLQDKDFWYRTEVAAKAGARCRLRFEGLATLTDIFWNGQRMARSDSMFAALEVEVEADVRNTLHLAFRALTDRLAARLPRARWRTQLVDQPGLRGLRTTLLGHMPGWCPEVEAVGPYRPVFVSFPDEAGRAPDIAITQLASTLGEDGTGVLALTLTSAAPLVDAELACAGHHVPLVAGPDGQYAATLYLPDVAPWWPATHGTPHLHEVTLRVAGHRHRLGRTGFRRVEVDAGVDGQGFGLVVNGVPVFARGAVWTSADILRLASTPEALRPLLAAAAGAGMNLLRIPGITGYEGEAFFALCDELGLMVWQDFQFANFDYPLADPAFEAEVRREAAEVISRLCLHPSLAVFCGGSEMEQQAAMMGLPAERRAQPLIESLLPDLVAALAPSVPYVRNSPTGGDLPFLPNAGIGHYYGVGAYLRPLEDARRTGVRFAGECLAFANVPEPVTLERELPGIACHDPRWKARVPRDRGAGWDFEDVRDHYLGSLYGVEPARLRSHDPERYLELSRAVTGEVMAATFAEWRRAGSTCRGAMVLALSDLLPGAGWGLIDAHGEPKLALGILSQVLAPVQVLITDEGTNGLDIHLLNETPAPVEARLELTAWRDGRTPVLSVARDVLLPPRSAQRHGSFALIGSFFDLGYAYRFGPPSHDVVQARLVDRDGRTVSAAFHLPLGRGRPSQETGLVCSLEEPTPGSFGLILSAERFCETVAIRDASFLAEANGFPLAPGQPRRVSLTRRPGVPDTARPAGTVSCLNGLSALHYSA
ncbi:glycoside hydrolase family 2 protein [Pannonibacter tanglangensis]|uniref:glycoside hydrolase family 2 protein n=1 Tax=Pannonibacter tanglangensis TaxID=2750084 RepID=UPI001AD91299|nr:glycoside hydrolase family 2 protein [Pannonibacter sp. XCT-53]